MTIVVNPASQADEWMRALSVLLPDQELVKWPHCSDPTAVDIVVAWYMPQSDLASFQNLRVILSLSAGIEHWQVDDPPRVPIVRLADPAMATELAAYALHWVLHFQRDFDRSIGRDDIADWGTANRHPLAPTEYPIGILGFGTIGQRIGQAFAQLGYPVNAWSRRGTADPGVRSFRGDEELAGFLSASRAVLNVLPDTSATSGLLTSHRFSQFHPGATFINLGRGSVIASEASLASAVDSGQLGAAVLDVTNPEPPSPDSPLLGHPRIRVTPHVAGTTRVGSASRLVADNILRIRRGEVPYPLVDPEVGY